MGIWRYCPACYRLADANSVLKRCPFCVGNPKNILQVLPLDEKAAQAAIVVGGRQALEAMIVALVAGDDAGQAYRPHWPDCAINHGGTVCDMGPHCGDVDAVEHELHVYPQLVVKRPK